MKCPKCQNEMDLKFSCTQLIQGTMCAFLKLTKDYAVSPDQRAFMLNGTRAHAKLEIAGAEDESSELEVKFLEGDISGISDGIETENGKSILYDNKVSGSYKVMKALGFKVEQEVVPGEFFKSGKRKGEPKTRGVLVRKPEYEDRWEWQLQLSFYAIQYENLTGKKIDHIKIQCLVRDGNTYVARGRGVFRNVYYFKIQRLPDAEVLAYFKGKREALLKALQEGQCDEICTAKENWDGLKCASYCEVAGDCKFGKYLIKEREREDSVMAIKGMSEIRRLPRLGKIRLGIKAMSQGGKEYPKEVDYFVLDPQTPAKEENDRLIQEFHRLYGNEPKKINIMFPVADPDVFFPQFYKRYGSSTSLQCKGDGVEATCMSEEFAKGLKITGHDEFGNPKVGCAGKECPYYKSKQCSETATLQVLLPELPGAGVWQITTGSFNSIVNINSCVDYVRAVAGRAHMIPLTLERREQEIAYDGKKTKHYILHINMDFKLADLQKQAMIEPSKILLELPEPQVEKEDILYEKNAVIDTEAPASKQGLIEEQLTGILEKIKTFKTRSEVDAFEKECEAMALEKVDMEFIRDHCQSARHTITGETFSRSKTPPAVKPSAPVDNGGGDLKRFGGNQARASELIEKIKQQRAKIGDEKFMKILGAQGWTTVAEITAITPLTTLLNALMVEAKK